MLRPRSFDIPVAGWAARIAPIQSRMSLTDAAPATTGSRQADHHEPSDDQYDPEQLPPAQALAEHNQPSDQRNGGKDAGHGRSQRHLAGLAAAGEREQPDDIGQASGGGPEHAGRA